jgi:hypothetical protein
MVIRYSIPTRIAFAVCGRSERKKTGNVLATEFPQGGALVLGAGPPGAILFLCGIVNLKLNRHWNHLTFSFIKTPHAHFVDLLATSEAVQNRCGIPYRTA